MAFWSHNQKSCACERTRRQHNRCSKKSAAFGLASCVLIFFPFFAFVHAILSPSNEDLASQTYKIVKNSVVSASATRCTGSFIIPDCSPTVCNLQLCVSVRLWIKMRRKLNRKRSDMQDVLKELELRSNSGCWMQWLLNSFVLFFSFYWQLYDSLTWKEKTVIDTAPPVGRCKTVHLVDC